MTLSNTENFATKKSMFLLIVALFVLGFALAEMAGWPFLAKPLQNKISELIDRKVMFNEKNNANSQQIPPAKYLTAQTFSLQFLGGISLNTQQLIISAPNWSNKPYFIDAKNVALQLRYVDLWRAYSGKPIVIKNLQAKSFQANLERLEDGRASWQFKKQKAQDQPVVFPKFDNLAIEKAFVQINDVPTQSNIKAKLVFSASSLNKNQISNVNELEPNAKNAADSINELTATADGTYKDLPLKIKLKAIGEMPSNNGSKPNKKVALTFDASIKKSKLKFKGTTQNIMSLQNFMGDFELEGPSMAAVGDVVNVTLPTTAAFNAKGSIVKQGLIWQTHFKQMDIGGSSLNGRFIFDKSLKKPLLTGKLQGDLVITDLGPAFGADGLKKDNKVLPTRPFDLASLQKMNADIKIDMQHLDLKTNLLGPLQPLQGHLTLKNANLTLDDIKASTAGGRLKGSINLNGAGKTALWKTNLAWNNVVLERWIKQKRDKGSTPYISGRLNGSANLNGQGKSSAQLLASLDGTIKSEITQGAISHLAIEIAGLDLADSLGVLFEGDEALPLECAVVNLQAKNGLFKPKAIIIDTADSTVWMDGTLSFANESLNLKAMSLPKDFSPLTLRAPLNITGNFSNPQVSIEKKPIGLKLAASALLAIVNPLAAVLPFVDTGNLQKAEEISAGCKKLMASNKNTG